MKGANLGLHNRTILSTALIGVFAWSLTTVDWGNNLLHSGGIAAITQIAKAAFKPDLAPEILILAVVSAWKTLAYATAGMTLAVLLAIPFGILASGILSSCSLNRTIGVISFRGILNAMRAVHELVWAWLFVAAMGLSPFAAIFALAIPYGGTLGRIFADILQDVPRAPLAALQAGGAGKLQLLFYGYFPMALPDMVSYTMYRFECALRSAAIMSFIGLGGLGYQIQISLQDLHYNEVWTFIFFLVLLVMLVDFWSNRLRRRLTA
ncbi:ABC transporter permease subunit [Metallumcola ferriviriculae]|uniref:ABC transporter permease subunit n=1 Tax=Metallumcola ferriviriculae TaxID=3039180 RepID=A0AAU0UMD2_9FIRM|nr:ABC transporter permease subunit [Desulfitibacteraceae bacterium MK1]